MTWPTTLWNLCPITIPLFNNIRISLIDAQQGPHQVSTTVVNNSPIENYLTNITGCLHHGP